jgi:hypothetical protein
LRGLTKKEALDELQRKRKVTTEELGEERVELAEGILAKLLSN